MRFRVFIVIIILFSVVSCARKGNPTGGPKDEDKPILIKTIPEYKSVNFKAKEIKIYFDEYIKLKDLRKQLVISPPLKYPAQIQPLGTPSKKITISISDTLIANTTYTFNFGESVVDNSEGNVLSNFKYIFSTGTFIDSLTVQGKIKSAFSKKADKRVSVLLYEANDTFNDSTIYKQKPLYVGNSLDSIAWEITNIKKGKYHIIALKDANNDFKFNPKTDKIGFLDSIVEVPTTKNYDIRMFKETLAFKPSKPVEASKGHLIFGYEGDAKKFKVQPINKDIIYTTFFDKKKDTLHFFYKLKKPLDSLKVNLVNGDFSENKTIKLRLKKIDTLKIANNTRGILNFNDTLTITSNHPIAKIDKSKIKFTDKDTVNVAFKIQKVKHEFKILFEKKEAQNYKLKLLPNAITDFFEQKNDTLKYSFRTTKKDQYGSINMQVVGTNNKSTIVQLIDDKEEVVAERWINKDKKVTFELLPPAKYGMRVIIDSNGNKKWDTGNYLKAKQPEDVIYFKSLIDVKQNWFVNETIDLK